jgi:hypothetical protein
LVSFPLTSYARSLLSSTELFLIYEP